MDYLYIQFKYQGINLFRALASLLANAYVSLYNWITTQSMIYLYKTVFQGTTLLKSVSDPLAVTSINS